MRTWTSLLCLVAGALWPLLARGQAPGPTYGVGLRVHGLFVPRGIFEQFVDVAPSGIRHPGVGIEIIRRHGAFEAALGFGGSRLAPDDGIWLNDDPDDNPHLVEFEDFSWLTLDLSTVWTYAFHPPLGLRYGLGVGLGFLRGDARATDYVCDAGRYDLASCRPSPEPEDLREPVDIPSVIPVVNALLGLAYMPSDRVTLSLEGGLHTTFFAGLRAAYFFP